MEESSSHKRKWDKYPEAPPTPSLDLQVPHPSGNWQWVKERKKNECFGVAWQLGERRESRRKGKEKEEEEVAVAVAACSNCHLLVIMCRSSPTCPNCKFVHSLLAPNAWHS
ncbi:hypothetical protein M569_02076 [Genlisea aurea]|uniref:Uncharacterized protein n=1 Tax=Genlisea aurea TaxID=192259 RepID=S8EJ83_9LAMI|nr:hypothetical protein M569_02076 [Genlisea aurea]